ncbi:Pyridoxal phosphate-dependent aminotransferase C-terminal domain protein [Candidatus Cyrtobacter comes]|uniref:Aminotransferase n=1 Tax=Candidatus Cyrtobacter comes TaxID=675776 RepID=A0ABU5L7T9_9RICK|nr:Pyridoxal phosphate-dependent aminotransferase C-terminal domain protein [Candidatus Cyrtobacter comes]
MLFSQEQILVGCGAKHLIFNALFACLNPGDEVIIPAPYWVSYPDMVKLTGAEPVIFLCTQEDDFKIKPQKLRKLITSKTKFFMLNSPSNPTGIAYTREEIKEIASVLLEHSHVLILSDDIYESMCFDGFEFSTIASVEPKLADRVITINGVSKSYSMTGWRIGYAAANVDIIKAMSKVQSQSTSNPCSISQAAAVEALTGPQDFISENNKLFQKRRDLVVGMLNNIDDITCHKPDGAFYAFANCEAFFGKKRPDGKIINGSVDFADYLLNEALVAVVPGAAFGAEGFFRVSYASSEDLLSKACTRIAEACSKLKN